jgi:phosphotransferase system enzyme I (PtsI)
MARSLNIPAIVGLHDTSEWLNTGDQVLLDGYNGLLIVNPSDQTLWEYGELEIKKEEVEKNLTRSARYRIDDARWTARHPQREY